MKTRKELVNEVPKGNVPVIELPIGTKLELIGFDMNCNYIWTPAILKEKVGTDVVYSTEGIQVISPGRETEYKIVN